MRPTRVLTVLLACLLAVGSTVRANDITVRAPGHTAWPGASQAAGLVPGNHPRLLIGPSRMPVYRARAAARTPEWMALKRHVDTFFSEPISTYFLPSFSALFALVYQVTGEARYGDRAAALAPKALQYMITSGQAPHPNLNFYREEVCSLAFAYDWAYDRLAPADRAAIASFLSTAAEHYITHWYSNGDDPVGNLTAGQVRANAVIAVAVAGDYPKAQALFDANRRFYIEKAVPALNSIAKGGALPEGSEYNGEIAHHYMQFLQIVKENTGEDLYSLAPFQKDLLYCTLLSTSPAGPRAPNRERNIVKRQPMPFGDIQTDTAEKLGYYTRMYMTQLADYFRASRQETLANHAQYWLTQMAPYYFDHTPGIATTFLNDFLYSDPKAAARDYRLDLPPDYLASGDGRMLSRSDWSADATWTGFDCGIQGRDHQHSDCLQFQIYRKGRWLTRETLGWGQPWYDSFLHNTLMMNEGSSFNAYMGGAPVGRGSISRYETNASLGYAYGRADGTRVYQKTGWNITTPITLAVRDYLYLKPDLFVVADQVAYNSPAMTAWYLQSQKAPTINSNRITIVNDLATDGSDPPLDLPAKQFPPQALFATVVIPAQAQVNTISNGSVVVNPPLLGYRTEVKSGSKSTAEQFLVVLEAADKGASPHAVTRVAARSANVAQFDKYVVGAGIGPSAESGRIEYSYQPAAKSTRHIIMGLEPSPSSSPRYYKVAQTVADGRRSISISKGSGADTPSTSAGLLVFDVDDSALLSEKPR